MQVKNTYRIYRLVLLTICILEINSLRAQEQKVISDLGLWNQISVKSNFLNDFTIEAEQQIRLNTNISKLDAWISDLGIEYRINKQFDLGANLRYIHNIRQDRSLEKNIRYSFDLKYQTRKSNAIRMGLRLRYQMLYENPWVYKDQLGESPHLRGRIRLAYPYKTLRPYLSSEIFRSIKLYKEAHFDKIRLMAGDRIKTNHGVYDLGFAWEHELNSPYPLNFFFLKVQYTYELKRRK